MRSRSKWEGHSAGFGPVGHDRELEHAVGQVRGRRRDADGVEIHHRHDLSARVEQVARVPIAMHHLTLPGVEAQLVHTAAGLVVTQEQLLSHRLHFSRRFRAFIGTDQLEVPAHQGGIVKAPGRLSPRGHGSRPSACETPPTAGRPRAVASSRAIVAGAGHEAKELVDVVFAGSGPSCARRPSPAGR